MNVKNNLCMNKAVKHILSVSALLLTVVGAAGQSVSYGLGERMALAPDFASERPLALVGDFHASQWSNPWMRGSNINGLRNYEVSMGHAELETLYKGGDFRTDDDPVHEWTSGAFAEGSRTFGKVSMAGTFSFHHGIGYDMTGSMFINPAAIPVDIVEFTPGRKIRQTYTIAGGLSYELNSHWRIGAKVDFLAANYSKLKDLRYSNFGMNFSIAPSFQYFSDDISAGMSYTFRKYSESVKAEDLGISEEIDYAFLDKGDFFGTYEAWEGSGVHLKEIGTSSFPVNQLSHSLAVQFQYRDFYTELAYSHSEGLIGERDTKWFDYPSDRVDWDLFGRYEGSLFNHYFSMRLSWDMLRNFEHVIDRTSEGGVIIVNDYARNRIAAVETFTLNPEYILSNDKLSFAVEAAISHRSSLGTQIYPFVAKRRVFTGSLRLSAIYNLPLGFELGGAMDFGGGTDRLETSGERPASLYWHEARYNSTREALNGPVMGGELMLKCTFWRGMYVAVSGACRGLLHQPSSVKGTARGETMLRLGYYF